MSPDPLYTTSGNDQGRVSGRLHELGRRYGTDKATFHGYLDFYEQHLPATVDRLLEIGIMDGASLKMWREFYPDADVQGIDNSRWPVIEGVTVWQGDATDRLYVEGLIQWGPYDVIIDDGSHRTADQQRSFELLWPAVTPGGVYVIEDLHTSYMSNYVNSPQTTLEWLAGLELDVTIWGRAQGDAAGFVTRHGFPADALEWTGPEVAESITSVIRKSAGHYNAMQGWIRD